jgi:hemoglobin-like flavoprotein
MTLPTDTVALIRESWAVLARDPDALTTGFYEELFRIAPHYKPMFAGTNLPAQRKKLAAALALVVRHADNLGPVLEPLKQMGRRHADYGVSDDDYAVVGAALLTTMERQLGPIFSVAMRDAWATAYGAVAATMQAGAAEPRQNVA